MKYIKEQLTGLLVGLGFIASLLLSMNGLIDLLLADNGNEAIRPVTQLIGGIYGIYAFVKLRSYEN